MSSCKVNFHSFTSPRENLITRRNSSLSPLVSLADEGYINHDCNWTCFAKYTCMYNFPRINFFFFISFINYTIHETWFQRISLFRGSGNEKFRNSFLIPIYYFHVRYRYRMVSRAWILLNHSIMERRTLQTIPFT